MLFSKCMGNLTISMAISIANCNSHYQRVNQVLQLLSRFLPIAILVGECEPRISAVASFSSTKPSICLVRWLLWKASVAGGVSYLRDTVFKSCQGQPSLFRTLWALSAWSMIHHNRISIFSYQVDLSQTIDLWIFRLFSWCIYPDYLKPITHSYCQSCPGRGPFFWWTAGHIWAPGQLRGLSSPGSNNWQEKSLETILPSGYLP